MGKFVAAGFLAFGLGILLTFATAALHGLCIEARLCMSRGDVNMSYWFHSLLAVPLFWAALAALGENSTESQLAAERKNSDSVAVALGQYRRGEAVGVRCPVCSSLVSVEQTAREPLSQTVRVTCSCGKCAGTFKLRERAA